MGGMALVSSENTDRLGLNVLHKWSETFLLRDERQVKEEGIWHLFLIWGKML